MIISFKSREKNITSRHYFKKNFNMINYLAKIGIMMLLIVIVSSCKKNNPSLSEQFSDKQNSKIKAEISPIDNKQFGDPFGLKVKDSLLFFSDEFNNKYFSVIDIKNKTMLKRFG